LYTRIYENAIDIRQLNDQTTLDTVLSLVKSDSQDTLHYLFYDANGNIRFEVNSLGLVGERRYDLAERKFKP